jgi:hypothetical protein
VPNGIHNIRTAPINRDDRLWSLIFNALTAALAYEEDIGFSRRAAMTDAAWRIAKDDKPISPNRSPAIAR